jgi:hypothetical protein
MGPFVIRIASLLGFATPAGAHTEASPTLGRGVKELK